MIINPALFWYLVAGIGILAVTVVLVVVSYLPMLRELAEYKKKERERQEEAQSKYQSLIDSANTQVAQVISAARKKAEEILNSANNLSTDSQVKLTEKSAEIMRLTASKLQEESDRSLEEYRKALRATQDDTIKILQKASEDTKSYSQTQMESLVRTTGQKTDEAIVNLKAQIERDWSQVHSDIESYRKRQYDRVDKEIVEDVEDIVSVVLGRNLPLNEHRELIVKAFEEVKKRHGV